MQIDVLVFEVNRLKIITFYFQIGMFTASKACQAEREMERIKFIPSIPLYVWKVSAQYFLSGLTFDDDKCCNFEIIIK